MSNKNSEAGMFLKSLITSNKTPGLQYVISKNNAIVYEQNLGIAEFETGKVITEKSFFNACSVTKTLTSLAVLQLAAAGNIKLSDPASVYLDEYPFSEEITIRQFLSHTSGLANPVPLRWAHLQEEDGKFDSDVFRNRVLTKYSKLKKPPGQKFSYSNLNYLVLGKLIEDVSGMNYRLYVHKNIISNINVSKSALSYTVEDDTDYARGYQQRFTFINAILGFFIDKKKFTEPSSNRKWLKFKKYYVSGTAYGGLIANAYSLSKFIEVLFRPSSVLLPDSWKKILLTKEKTNDGREVPMTLGWFTGKLKETGYFTHAGAGGGYYCEMRIYPEINMITAIMFNRSGMADERFLNKVDHYFL
jgi:D-alanyl-D-alanine carboxypeptidase